LIPAGTGMEFYRNVRVERDPSADQSGTEDRGGLEDMSELIGGNIAPAATTRAGVATLTGDGSGAVEE